MFVETETLKFLLPEIILVAVATWIIVAGTFWQNRAVWSMYAVAGYVIVGLAMYRQELSLGDALASGQALASSGPLAVDLWGHTSRWVALLSGLIITLMASQAARKEVACEVLGLIMFATAGAMLVSAASEMVLLFLGLELISIPTYVLLFIGRPGRASAEATAKYFFLSILSSALLLYGFSFLYGIAGTTVLVGNESAASIRDALARPDEMGIEPGLMKLAPLAIVLLFAGLGFKMAAVPFHFYAPDVYQGTTNANAGLLSVLPKLAGAIALVRLLVVALPVFAAFAWQLALVISILTMTLGNVCALWQTNVRRMMAYSSIAHAGYLLIGLTVALGSATFFPGRTFVYGGSAALLLYLVVYTFATLGTFAVLSHLSSEEREVGTLDELAGLNKTKPIAAGLMAVFMFSLAGIPPLAGFWGKFALFYSAVEIVTASGGAPYSRWFVVLAVAGALNAAIAAAYYLRIVGALYFRPSTMPLTQRGGAGPLAAAVICGVVVVLIGVSPGRSLSTSRLAERALQTPPPPVSLAEK